MGIQVDNALILDHPHHVTYLSQERINNATRNSNLHL